MASVLLSLAGSGTNGPVRSDRGYAYLHLEDKEVPWSIHVFRVDRRHPELTLGTTLGGSNRLGMATVSEQLKAVAPQLGKPLAAINGDFYIDEPELSGDPRDLQIHEGELISAPNGNSCFWVDPSGAFHLTNVVSRLRVVWPDGSEMPVGLNQLREKDAAVLYTRVAGEVAPTEGGTELVLEGADAASPGSWLPLRPGQRLHARVREVHRAGRSPLAADRLVLSLGPALSAPAHEGSLIQVLTETSPDLSGVQTALGGGPTLIRDGKAREWSGFQLRHPRSAIGWNKDHLFLVQVDGRQAGLSVGMTFPEFADYLLKLGCDDAMNLDGGGSATLWVYGQVMSSPSEGQERPGANALVVFQRRPGATPTAH